jgi:hypothetical protein
VTGPRFTDAQLDAALGALSDPDRFRDAEQRVAAMAPQLQRIFDAALNEGGWFGRAHDSELGRAALIEDPAERLASVRALLADETRLGMLVGVAVGWELARELEGTERPADPSSAPPRSLGICRPNNEEGTD